MDANGAREIEEAVQRALAAGGIQGTVTLTGRTMTLRAGGAPVEIDALYLIEQWPLLPPDLRERKAVDVAARLADAHRAAKAGVASPSVRPPTPSIKPTGAPPPGRKPIVLPLGTLFLLVLAGALAWLFLKDRPEPAPSGAAASSSARPEAPDERRARVCEVARKRVLETGTLAQLDAEVWLAELWLASSRPGDDMTRSEQFAALVAHGKLTPVADPDLAVLREAEVEILPEEPSSGHPWRALHVRFHGGYVSAFFDTAGREKMNRVASRLADATGAQLGALYGRCAHLRHHDIGAWFRGASPALATGALMYSMAYFSERRLTNRDPSTPPTTGDLVTLLAATAKLDKAKVETAVRDSGGTFAPGLGDAPTTIVFPLGGPTRAARAAGQIATDAGMGADAPRPGGD